VMPVRMQTTRNSAGDPTRPALRRAGRGGAVRLVALLALAALLAGCLPSAGARQLADKARALWEGGRYQDAARNFITVSELYPSSALAEESLYWAACLYQYYIQDPELAGREYQHLLVSYPKGHYFYDAKLNLAEVYEQQKETQHRALQIYQQLLLADEMADRRDWLHLRIARLNLRMGKMDQARMEVRDLLVSSPQSPLRAQAYYLAGYSYYLEKRYDMALFAFEQTAKDFPGTPTALRAQYFVADTLEEQGQMREALKAYTALRGKYPNPDIVEKRIKTLEARIRRGVR
jgi:TolA-binding protein